MALIGNYSILNRQLSRAIGQTIVANTPNQICPTGFYKNRFGTYNNNAATPNGYLHPAAWVLPMKSGGMSSYNQSSISLTKTDANLIAVRYLVGTSTITISKVDAQLGQIFAAIASGSISVAQGVVDLSALFSAVGSSIISFTLTNATLGGTFAMGGSSTITVTPSGLLTAIAFMEAQAGGATPLSPEGLAAAVWSASAADFNDVGSMGEKLNDAGSASNPWTEVIESGYTAAEILKLLAAVSFGKTNIVDNGGGSATVTFRDLADTKDRVDADMVGSERSTVTLDAT